MQGCLIPFVVPMSQSAFSLLNVVFPAILQRSSDGSLSQEEEAAPVFGKVGELQEVVERQTADLGQMKERMAVMVSRVSELEEDLDTARKDLIKSEEVNTRLGRDLREVSAVLGGLEAERINMCVAFFFHLYKI